MPRNREGARELIAIALLGALVLGVAIIVGYEQRSGSSSRAQQPAPTLQQDVTPTAIPTEMPVAPSPTGVDGTPEVGEPFSSPAFAAQDLTLIHTDAAPLMSQEQAMQAVFDLGVPWGLGGEWEGRQVTVQAFYGLATFGGPGPGGVWSGPRNIPLPSGEILDHIEGRPMWIIDYGNTYFIGAGCPDCPEPPEDNHSVYAVDAETGQPWFVWGYVGE